MEQTRISSSPSPAAHEARGARGASKAGGATDDQAAAQGDGFALLLAALGGGEGAATVLDTLSVAGEALQTPEALPDAGALAAWAAGLQPGAALAQRTGEALAAEADALAGRLGLGLVRAGQDTLVGQTALLDGAAERAALQGGASMAGPGSAAGRGTAWRAQGMALQAAAQDAASAAGDALRAGAHAARSGLQHAADTVSHLAAQVSQAVDATAQRRDGVPVAGTPLQAQPGEWMAAQAAPAGISGAAPGSAAAGAGGAATPTGLRGADAAGTSGAEPFRSPAEGAGLEPADATLAGMAGAEDALADQLAEQVAYWVHQKTQNAELTLDQDGRPVEVRVALTGDEAHVTFRSDQADARQWLDGSTAQLREMLQREGLQLAGVTVGTAGGGAADRQGRRDEGRPGARQAAVQAAAPAGQAGGGRGVAERSVDIFV
ncbi:flagellar hook-length control protein FliK [Diaphorobacter nitroreducens]|uniref:flagellar hook-length control protein FliK n=1 Tax=Diaphorobacter nitroreducens TaxID=164759 RepID=UPI0028AF3440|nr:flagellar hook-length control protein FliK [Diaphorobacter nitroreducens]